MATIGDLLTEARGILNDVIPTDGATRYSDTDLVTYLNDALTQIRAKRPDAFLDIGLRVVVPRYAMPDDATTLFPLDMSYWPACSFYVTGMAELREDTFSDNSRAVTLMNKFASQLLQVAS